MSHLHKTNVAELTQAMAVNPGGGGSMCVVMPGGGGAACVVMPGGGGAACVVMPGND